MFSNVLLVLTIINYIGLAILNIQKTNATGERLMGSGFIGLGLIAAYVLFSLLLTISITSKGGFNWLSSATLSRNFMVGILWFCMIAGVVFCAMLSTEMNTDRTTGILRILSRPVYYGSVWLPLLMLIPYAILLNPHWREIITPGIYKIPLLMAGLLGFVIVMIPQIVISMNIRVPTQSAEEWKKENLTPSIEKETSVETLLNYAKDGDKWVRDLAANRLKSLPNWEDELIVKLQRADGYGHYDFHWVYTFLDQYSVDQPDRFVDPINSSLESITKATEMALAKSFVYSGDLTLLQIDVVCRVLDHQFKGSSEAFRGNRLRLQKALETPPTEPSQNTPEFIEMIKPYQMAVNEWLERNKD